MLRIIFATLTGLFLFSYVYAQPPQRYISLAPSTTEILFALGLDQEIVGVSSFCDYPEAAKHKEKLGDFSHPSVEKIVSLKPDYIFCTGLEQEPVIAEIKRIGLKLYIADPRTLEELYKTITDIGIITRHEPQAIKIVQDMRERIGRIQREILKKPVSEHPKVFIEIWSEPLTTAGKGTFIDALVTAAGGENIAYDTKRAYSVFSPEEVIKRQPDVIITTYMMKNAPTRDIGKRFGWNTVSAVREKRVYSDIDTNILLRPGPRVAEGIEELYKRFYP